MPGHDAEDAGDRAAGRELGRRRGRVQAAVARPLVRDEGRELALEAEHGGVDDRDAGRDRGVVEDVARLERVGAVEDDVVAGDDPLDVRGDEHLLVGDDLDLGVERVDRPLRGLDLALPHPVGRVDDLALEVADVDDVEVDDADRPDAGGGEVERRRRAEAAGADEQRLRAEQPRLAGGADLGDQQVAAVALLLLGGQDDRRLERRGRRPSRPGSRRTSRRRPCSPSRRGSGRRTASGRRRRSRGSTGASRSGATRLDLLLDVALGDVGGAGQVALLPLGRLADVDDDGGARGRGRRPPGGVTSLIWARASRRRSA